MPDTEDAQTPSEELDARLDSLLEEIDAACVVVEDRLSGGDPEGADPLANDGPISDEGSAIPEPEAEPTIDQAAAVEETVEKIEQDLEELASELGDLTDAMGESPAPDETEPDETEPDAEDQAQEPAQPQAAPSNTDEGVDEGDIELDASVEQMLEDAAESALRDAPPEEAVTDEPSPTVAAENPAPDAAPAPAEDLDEIVAAEAAALELTDDPLGDTSEHAEPEPAPPVPTTPGAADASPAEPQLDPQPEPDPASQSPSGEPVSQPSADAVLGATPSEQAESEPDTVPETPAAGTPGPAPASPAPTTATPAAPLPAPEGRLAPLILAWRWARVNLGPPALWVWARTQAYAARLAPMAATGALLISKPLEDKSVKVRHTVGVLALYTLFMAACLWLFAMFGRSPDVPATDRPAVGVVEDADQARAITTDN